MATDESQDELLDILDDDQPVATEAAAPWHVLVVDDDPSVLAATLFALRNVTILGRPLRLVTASSAAEAVLRLATEPDIAVALLDVVMERPDAGLRLVETIRGTMHRSSMRIVIRTGQPGYAPELEVIHRYDINDYRTKADLDHTRLVTTLTTAIRAFHQISVIECHRAGLEKVVNATGSLLAERSLVRFAEGVLTQICNLAEVRPEGVLVVRFADGDPGRIIAAAGRFADLAGQPVENAPADVVQWVVNAADGLIGISARSGGMRVLAPNGDELLVHFVTSAALCQVDADLLRLFTSNVAVGFDNVRLYEEVSRAAFIDPDTGLANRAGWVRAARGAGVSHVTLLRVPELETVRLLFGADAASRAAADIGAALTTALPHLPAGVACVGPGQFALAAGEDQMPLLRQTVAGAGVQVGDAVIAMSATLALARSTDAEQALDDAMVALTQAAPNAIVRYTPSMGQALAGRMRMLSDMETALRDGCVHVHLQPQVRLVDGALIGAEALVRWMGADGKLISPAQFIPLAEDTGLILPLGRRVAELTAAVAAKWRGRGLRLSINVSPRELLVPDLAARLADLVAAADIRPYDLMIEITESAFASDCNAQIQSVEALAAAAFPLSIDDFGTGQSSLARLASLPVAELKLDRSLCGRVDSDPRARRIAALVTELGRDLNIHVLAEGIETQEQADVLRDLGCGLAQGFLFGRPMPLDSFETLYFQDS